MVFVILFTTNKILTLLYNGDFFENDSSNYVLIGTLELSWKFIIDCEGFMDG
jgi:hypothetical protein